MKTTTPSRSALARRLLIICSAVSVSAFHSFVIANEAPLLDEATSANKTVRVGAESPLVLSPVVITATRTPTPVEATAASVTVITRKEMDNKGYGTAAEALRDVPGLFYGSPGPGASAGRLLMRGTASRHTLILLDGRRLPAGLAGNFDVANLPMSGFERIEIVRGASSAVSGGNAVGGVINVITHKPAPDERVAIIKTEVGSFGSMSGEVFTSAAKGDVNASVGVNGSSSDNDRQHNSTEIESARATAGWQVTPALYTDLSTIYFHSDAELPNKISVNDKFATLDTEIFSVSPSVHVKTGNDLTQSLCYSFTQQELNPRGFIASFTPTDRTVGSNGTTTIRGNQLDYQADWQATDSLILTAGATWLRTESERFNDGTGSVPFGFTAPGIDVNRAEESRAVFTQAQWEAYEGLNFIEALRYEKTSGYGEYVAWRSGASWRAPRINTLLHSSYATAFAPPSVQDTSTALFGNPGLSAETAKSWEVGVEQPLVDNKLKVDATYYHNKIDSLIVSDPSTFELGNIGSLTNQGVELGVELQPISTLTIRSDYTMLEQNAENDSLGLSYIGRPSHVFQNTIIWQPVSNINYTVGVRHVRGLEDFGGVDQPNYTVIRTAVQWVVIKNVTVFARVENVADINYAEVPGFTANPLGLYLGLKWVL